MNICVNNINREKDILFIRSIVINVNNWFIIDFFILELKKIFMKWNFILVLFVLFYKFFVYIMMIIVL